MHVVSDHAASRRHCDAPVLRGRDGGYVLHCSIKSSASPFCSYARSFSIGHSKICFTIASAFMVFRYCPDYKGSVIRCKLLQMNILTCCERLCSIARRFGASLLLTK